ncbi:carbohydrate esterase family 16 protein [Chaetomium sp. MPI-SDFR-AT-0129]|nr:carbohydrate esterase family 16 protein [Chaetomium sp. MPI-SDFR-AT-0129]
MTLLTPTLLALLATTTTAACTPRAPSTKYLITFGDSYSQTGFNITSTPPSASNPLGNPPLPGWTASGGYNWVGFLTAHYNASTLLTYNFAYGGATTNASLVTPYEPTVLSFVDQVAEFSGSIGGEEKPWTGEDALFGVWMGVNDVGNSWWTEGYGELVEEIMDSYFGRLQVLYEAGGRNFVLLSVPPIQRTPSVLNNSDEAAQQQEAAAIDTYNAALAARLEEFTTANSGVTAKIVDTAVPFNTALDDPTAYGAPDNTCFNADGESCLWFNDYHPGVEINNLVAAAVAEAWKGSFF